MIAEDVNAVRALRTREPIVSALPARLAAFALALYAATVPLAYVVAARPAGTRFTSYLALHAVLTVLGLLVWAALRRAHRPSLVLAVVAVGVVARLSLVFVPTFTTTDVPRYLWDGAVVVSGHDPYALAPQDDALTSLASQFPGPVDHPDVPTCYPPLALALFALCSSTGATSAWLLWKLLVALASIATVLVVYAHLRGKETAGNVALVALGPIPLLEGGVGGHLDSFVALAVVVAVIAALSGRCRTAALAIGCAAALKIVPAVLALVLLRHASRRLEWLAIAAAPAVLSVSASLALGMIPIGSLPLMAETWSFGSPVWAVLTWLSPEHEGRVRVVMFVGGIALIVLVALRRPLVQGSQEVLGVALAANPTLYPWYAAALAPLVALRPSAWAIALLAVLPTSYEVLDAYQSRGEWTPASWPIVLIGLAPIAAALAGSAVMAVRRAAHPVAPEPVASSS